MSEIIIPVTDEQFQALHSNPKEYNRIAKANNKSGSMGVIGLAQKGLISDSAFHMTMRYLFANGGSGSVEQRANFVCGLIEKALASVPAPKPKATQAARFVENIKANAAFWTAKKRLHDKKVADR